LFSGGTLLKTEFSTKLQAVGVNATAYAATALESREAHITTSTKIGSLKQGKCSVIISRTTGLRLTVI
jgi:hypothetical protein